MWEITYFYFSNGSKDESVIYYNWEKNKKENCIFETKKEEKKKGKE